MCAACAKELPILPQTCNKCAQFLPNSPQNTPICGQCLTKPPAYHRVYACFPYTPPIPRMISGLKFTNQLQYNRVLSHFLLAKIRHDWYPASPLPDIILPMPLHKQRLRERGYNQAVVLAKPLAKSLHIPLDLFGVVRTKATKPQSSLPATLRRKNIAQAFTAKRAYHGLHIAVVDDVMTTGQTVSVLAEVLKKQGAKRIDIWCAARCDSRQK